MRNPSSSAALKIGERDGLDSFDRNRPRVDLGAECERGEDRELMRGVKTADVKCRIRLRIAKPLSLAEADLEREMLGLHARKDVVAGAVEDAGNALNRIAGQALPQGLDDGYAAAHRRFEEQLRARSLGDGRELKTVRREHRLVRRDDGDPTRKRGLDGVERDPFGAADQLDENVDVCGRRKLRRVGEVSSAAKIDPPVVLTSRAEGGDRQAAPRPLGQAGVLSLKKPNEARPDHPETGDAQAKRVRHLLLAPPCGDLDFERNVPSSRLEIKGERAAQPYRSAADFFFFFRSLRAA